MRIWPNLIIVKIRPIIVKIRPLGDKLFYPTIAGTIAGLLAGLIVAYAVAAPIKISASTADSFFSNYFRRVSDARQRYTLYETNFTSDFRSFESWASYESFWNGERDATASQAIPTPGNPLEFQITVTFYPVAGQPWQQSINYFLTCNGFVGSAIARITGCPQGDIEIDRLEWVNPAAN